jgi:hypothetical protein
MLQSGDDVYIEDIMLGDWEEGDMDLCEGCGSGHDLDNMLECASCLVGYHMACLKPKLKKAPEVRTQDIFK